MTRERYTSGERARAHVRALTRELGGVRAAAALIDVAPSTISRAINGERPIAFAWLGELEQAHRDAGSRTRCGTRPATVSGIHDAGASSINDGSWPEARLRLARLRR